MSAALKKVPGEKEGHAEGGLTTGGPHDFRVRCPPKGDPKRVTLPKDHSNVTYKSHLSHSKVLSFPDPPFSDLPLGDRERSEALKRESQSRVMAHLRIDMHSTRT